jgi:predicted kinase
VEGLGAGLSPRLLLLNGPPAVGKSTIAHRYADGHPLALVVDIDELRVRLGQWRQVNESKGIARSLGLALVRDHLRRGHDVVVPQLLGLTDFIETLAEVAQEAGAEFVEVLLRAPAPVVEARLADRRAELERTGRPHPQDEVDVARVPEVVASVLQSLDAVARTRPATIVVDASGDDPAAVYAEVLRRCGLLRADPSG